MMPGFEQSNNQVSTGGGWGRASVLSQRVCSIPVNRRRPFVFSENVVCWPALPWSGYLCCRDLPEKKNPHGN